jgi:membrane peptidoglycan carboxypeptidase
MPSQIYKSSEPPTGNESNESEFGPTKEQTDTQTVTQTELDKGSKPDSEVEPEGSPSKSSHSESDPKSMYRSRTKVITKDRPSSPKSRENNPRQPRELIVLPMDEPPKGVDDLLFEDGHLVVKSVKVVKNGSKVSTEFSKGGWVLSDDDKADPRIGKKTHTKMGDRVDLLRKKLGSNWKKIGRQLVLVLLVLGLLAVVGVSAVAAWALDIWNNTSSVDTQPAESSIIYARDGKTELFKFFKEEKREVVPICGPEPEKEGNCIPESMQLAIIALEDENFYYNEDGIPWSNIAGSALKCVTSVGDNCRGGSGLSQQLVKNVTKDDDPTLQRKVRELFTSIKLNQEKNKKDILGLYLNQVPFGRNAYGAQEAARSYFGMDIKQVGLAQACYLAALVQQPGSYSASIEQPESETYRQYEDRKNICLEKMRTKKLQGDKFDYVIKSDEELKAWQQAKPDFVPNKIQYLYPHFRDFVTEELRKFNISEQALYTRGYKITTTLDPQIQTIVEQAIKDNEKGNILANGANNAAALVLDGPSGEILAMVGSRDYYNKDIDGQVNVVTSPQQPGSSFKPYVYAAAFAQNFNPATILIDAPTDFGGFRPKNYSGTFSGPISMRNALQQSLNIPAVKAAVLAAGSGKSNQPDPLTGINKVFDMAEDMGVRFPCIPMTDGAKVCNDPAKAPKAYRNRCMLGSAIGGCELTMISHATGINTLAQEGNLRTATPFISIVDSKTGIDIYKRRQESDNPVYPKRDAVIDPLIARQMNNVMSDYAARYPVFGRRLASNLELDGWTGPNAIAAKTGTTDQVRDTWAVGYSPYYTVTTWVGNTDNSPMRDTASGASSAAFVFKQIMTEIHKNKEKKGFSTQGLQSVGVDPTTGLLDPNSRTREWMTPSQVKALEQAGTRLSRPDYNPRNESIFTNRSSIVVRSLKVNRLDGKLAVEGKTLAENIEEKRCADLVSEFPAAPNWFGPADAIAKKFPDRYGGCPSETSDQDQVANQASKPLITANVTTGGTVSGSITASATPTGLPGKTIAKMEIYINGALKASSSTGTIVYDISAVDSGPNRTIRIVATDSQGATGELVLDGVTLVNASIVNTSVSKSNPTVSATSSGVSGGLTFTITQNGKSDTCSPVSISGNTISCSSWQNSLINITDGQKAMLILQNGGSQIDNKIVDVIKR